MKIKEVKAGKVSEPSFSDRMDLSLTKEELDHLAVQPVDVIYSKESKTYFCVRGRRYVHAGKEKGIAEFTCNVIGSVKSDHEANAERFIQNFTDFQPLDIMEQTLAVDGFYKLVTSKVETDSLYEKGGDRKSEGFERDNVDSIISERLPVKVSTIGILRRFAENIGGAGIRGLRLELKKWGRTLPLRVIQAKNAVLKEKDFNAVANKLREDDLREDEVITEIGGQVYNVIFTPKQPNGEAKQPDDGETDDGPEEVDDSNEIINLEDVEPSSIDAAQMTEFKTVSDSNHKQYITFKKFVDSKSTMTKEDSTKTIELIKRMEMSYNSMVKYLYKAMHDSQ
jgi:hypothetical protein